MKLEVDFTKEFEEEVKELAMLAENPTPPTPEEWEQLNLMIELANTKDSEYIRKKDKELWGIWVEEFYPLFCDFAKTQGGKATIEIDEETFVGTLTYYGHDLIINNVDCTVLEDFALLNLFAEDVFISSEDSLLEIKVIFHVYEKIKVADNTDKFEAIFKKAKNYHQEQRLRRLLDYEYEE